jgi:hypothetical protein
LPPGDTATLAHGAFMPIQRRTAARLPAMRQSRTPQRFERV